MKTFKIHFLNTIWSDSMILEYDNHFGIVDTASKFYYPMIKDYLTKLNIQDLDFVFLSHFHSDHYGNLTSIINEYNVKKLYIKKYSGHEGITGSGYQSNEEYLIHEKERYEEILAASSKCGNTIFLDDLDEPYIINFNGINLEVYNLVNHLVKLYDDPNSSFYHVNKFTENANSAPIYFEYKGHKVFLGSDCCDNESSVSELNTMARTIVKKIYKRHNIDYFDIYKSCHHGGGGTNGIELLKLIKPKHMIITNTDKYLNNWKTIENAKCTRRNVKIYQTDYYQYVFDLSKVKLNVLKIPNESLFLQLNKS